MKRRSILTIAILSLFIFVIWTWNRCRSLQTILNNPAIQLTEIKFDGQQRVLKISDPALLKYFTKCFQNRTNLDKPGLTYDLTIYAHFLQPVGTYAYLPPSRDGLYIDIPTISTELWLDDRDHVFIPFVEPSPPQLSQILDFLESSKNQGKQLIIGKTRLR